MTCRTLQGKHAEKLQQRIEQLKSILTELEEWLKITVKPDVVLDKGIPLQYIGIDKAVRQQVLDKIQRLKEKYK